VVKEFKQNIEHGGHTGQACGHIVSQPMVQALQVADNGYHRQGRFHEHAFVPGAFLAEFDMGVAILNWRKAEDRGK
jgi:hypothetical protein